MTGAVILFKVKNECSALKVKVEVTVMMSFVNLTSPVFVVTFNSLQTSGLSNVMLPESVFSELAFDIFTDLKYFVVVIFPVVVVTLTDEAVSVFGVYDVPSEPPSFTFPACEFTTMLNSPAKSFGN